MQKAIIFDIDGTLANNSHRLHFLEGKKDWDGFFSCLDKDKLILETVNLYKILSSTQNYVMLIVSGRPERFREQTEKWLNDNGIEYQMLFLRGPQDRRPDYLVKQEIFQEIKKKYSVEFAFDDRGSVVEMWRRNGVFCFQCPGCDMPKYPSSM